MAESVVGPWARDKLERLRKYLHAYTTIMRRKKFEGYHYIDAFAGPGQHTVRTKESPKDRMRYALLDVAAHVIRDEAQHREFLAGSPRVALDLEFPFTTYVFVERSADRIANLQGLAAEYGQTRTIAVRKADCTKYLEQSVANNPRIDWRANRAFVFLDPFGMQVGWRTIELLAATRAIEIFLNFPVGMAIQRLLPRQPEKFSETQRRRLDEYFGSPEWFDVLYRKNPTLFGEEHEKIDRSGEALVQWYRGRLRTLFPYVSKQSLVRNTRGGHLYYLLLASHNVTGVRIANDIFAAE